MSKKAIIFDLDGTLVDSLGTGIEIVNELKIINRILTREDYEKSKNMTIPALLKEYKVPLWRAPQLLVKGRSALTKRINEIPFFEGMEEALAELSHDYRLFVMSSNSISNVRKLLSIHNVRQYFEQIYGGAGLFSKASAMNRIVRHHKLDKQNTYYVGDEVRDILAAKKAKLNMVSVTWGFNGEEILRSHKPDYIVRTPEDLTELFSKISA